MKKKHIPTGWLLLTAIAIALGVFYFLSFEDVKKEGKGTQEAKAPQQIIEEIFPEPAERESPVEPPVTREIAIIIDDIGENLTSLQELLKIDAPLSFAVLPHCSHSIAAAELMKREGRDILLHLPMEPYRYPEVNPGAGAIFVAMANRDIAKTLDDDLGEVPYAVGVNNHMGSRFMEDVEKVEFLFTELRKKGLFFIDSKTTAQSWGKEAAIKTGIIFAERKVFIDNGQNYRETYETLMDLLDRKESGKTVLIGHPYPSTIRALGDAVPALRSGNIEIIPISAMMRGKLNTSAMANEEVRKNE